MNQMPLRGRPAAAVTQGNVKIGDGIGSLGCGPDIQPAGGVAC